MTNEHILLISKLPLSLSLLLNQTKVNLLQPFRSHAACDTQIIGTFLLTATSIEQPFNLRIVTFCPV